MALKVARKGGKVFFAHKGSKNQNKAHSVEKSWPNVDQFYFPSEHDNSISKFKGMNSKQSLGKKNRYIEGK